MGVNVSHSVSLRRLADDAEITCINPQRLNLRLETLRERKVLASFATTMQSYILSVLSG